mmetsp:Transcript_21061/g.38041  ORF Transcript_21061/g.38041 Transcript_21061/m.38041 type:complete len:328 (-) Transcript_21061:11-994(-)
MVHLTCQYFGIHNAQDVGINLNALLFSFPNFSCQAIVHGFSQPRFQLLNASLQKHIHNFGQRVLHHIRLPAFQRKVRIQLPQLPDCNRILTLCRNCIIDRAQTVDPRILTCLPCLVRVLFNLTHSLLCILCPGLFVELVCPSQNILNDGSFAESLLHAIPGRHFSVVLVEDHNGSGASVLIGCLVVIFGHITTIGVSWLFRPQLFVNVLGSPALQQIFPSARNSLLEDIQLRQGSLQGRIVSEIVRSCTICTSIAALRLHFVNRVPQRGFLFFRFRFRFRFRFSREPLCLCLRLLCSATHSPRPRGHWSPTKRYSPHPTVASRCYVA